MAARRTIPVVAMGSTVVLEGFSWSRLRPSGMSLIGRVLAETAHTAELVVLFRERLVKNRRAQREGEPRAGVSLGARR